MSIIKDDEFSIEDISIKYPKLGMLHLELIENPEKLKTGIVPVNITEEIVEHEELPPEFTEKYHSDKHSDKHDDKNDSDDIKEFVEDKVDKQQLEEQERKMYLRKLKILKKRSPNLEIPDYSEHTPLSTLRDKYEELMQDLHLDHSVDQYKTYLAGSFMIMEIVGTSVLNMPVGGFAKTQLANMNKYDSLLIELGEKSYSSKHSSLPVEVRLIGFALLQFGIFYVSKFVTIDNMGGLFNTNNNQKEKKRMRGPQTKPDDIKKMMNQFKEK